MNTKKIYGMALFCLAMFQGAFAQVKITGKVMDETGFALPGATVLVKNTRNGTNTDFEGNFSLESESSEGILEVSFVGYATQEIAFDGIKTDLGTIQLSLANNLEEVVIQGVIDVARDRQTPVASSTIKGLQIQEKLGSQEFPELLRSTPSVYVTKSGGGWGDARINVRGFSGQNVLVLINGVPVNDMENGWVYWSNWSGLSDVTSAMQIQRGLSSSQLAIASVGGAINIITKTARARKGGSVSANFGNNGYMKYRASYSTGKLKSGLSASVLLSRTQGDGYVEGTKFLGHAYFVALGYEINSKHSLEFTFTGAPQWHHQRSYAESIETYQKYGTDEKPKVRYNGAWGYLDGKEFSLRRNFYHKPVMSLNYDFKINPTTHFSTVLYHSTGFGGGTGPIGNVGGKRDWDPKLKNKEGLMRWDDIIKWNKGESGHGLPGIKDRKGDGINDRRNGLSRRASMNNHNWNGMIAKIHKEIQNLTFDAGIDLRDYSGAHFRVLSDYLGAKGYKDNRNKNEPNRNITKLLDPSTGFNPWRSTKDMQKIGYHNIGNVAWYGAFGQVEYKNDKISTFVQGGASRIGFQRVDYFNLPPEKQKSSFKNIYGGNVKAGINYNINSHHNIFVNSGYFIKQPNFGAVYTSYVNNDVNPFLKKEKILSFEAGYGFKAKNYNLNINVYRTSWKDRFLRAFGRNGSFTEINGVEQVHLGFELEGEARFFDRKLAFNAMLSLGDYSYHSDALGNEYDQDINLVKQNVKYYLKGVRVGDAAQTTANIGLTYRGIKNLRIYANQFFARELYPRINPTNFRTEADNKKGSLRLPNYHLTDLGASYRIALKHGMSVNVGFNINNLLDILYISDGITNIQEDEKTKKKFQEIDVRNRVYFGFGRTWNSSLRFRF